MANTDDQKAALARIRAAAREQDMDDVAEDPGLAYVDEDEDFEPSEEDLAELEEFELEDDDELLELEEEITDYPEDWTSLDELVEEEDVPDEDDE